MLIVELNDLNVLKSKADAFLIGVKNFSSECYRHFEVLEVIQIIQEIRKLEKLAFIDLTNIYHDQDLVKVKEVIGVLGADGYFYFDLGIMHFIEEEKRFYYAPTYLTNQYDIHIASSENKFVLVSPELSFNELKNLEYDDKTYLIAFGPWEIFHSRRSLLSNYFDYRNKVFNKNAKFEIIEEFRNDLYPIVENNGTRVYLNGFYYLGEELKELTKNIIIKTFDLEAELVVKIVDLYQKYLENFDVKIVAELATLELDLNKGLLYEQSILKKGGNNE